MNKILVIVFVLILPNVFNTCGVLSEKEDKFDQQTKEEIRQQVLHLATKYNANIQWLAFSEGSDFFTVELQQVLLEPPEQAYLLLAAIIDIIKKDDKIFLTAADWTYGIYYQLQCNEQQMQYVLPISKNETRYFKEYAIVMNPKSVHKPVAQLVGELDIDYAYVTHDVNDLTVVKGVCLDILSLGDSSLDIEDVIDTPIEIE